MKPIYLTIWTFKDSKGVLFKTKEMIASGTVDEMKKEKYYIRKALREIIPGEFTEEKMNKYQVVDIKLTKQIGTTNG